MLSINAGQDRLSASNGRGFIDPLYFLNKDMWRLIFTLCPLGSPVQFPQHQLLH